MKLTYNVICFFILGILFSFGATAAQKYCTKESEQSKFITGIVVPIDGGFSAFSGV